MFRNSFLSYCFTIKNNFKSFNSFGTKNNAQAFSNADLCHTQWEDNESKRIEQEKIKTE